MKDVYVSNGLHHDIVDTRAEKFFISHFLKVVQYIKKNKKKKKKKTKNMLLTTHFRYVPLINVLF